MDPSQKQRKPKIYPSVASNWSALWLFCGHEWELRLCREEGRNVRESVLQAQNSHFCCNFRRALCWFSAVTTSAVVVSITFFLWNLSKGFILCFLERKRAVAIFLSPPPIKQWSVTERKRGGAQGAAWGTCPPLTCNRNAGEAQTQLLGTGGTCSRQLLTSAYGPGCRAEKQKCGIRHIVWLLECHRHAAQNLEQNLFLSDNTVDAIS